MARIRTIKPEFPQSESMGRISRESRLCFILLWTIADDEGRLRGNSRMLASLLYPYDDDAPKKISGWLEELEGQGCVIRYEADGNNYLQVCNWLNHQKIDKPSKSKMPAFDESSRILANPRECSSEDLRIKDQGKEGSGVVATPSASPSATTKASRLQIDWQLPKAWGEWAMKERSTWTAEKVRKTAEKFRDHWISKPGKDGTKLNWEATWRNWVRAEGDDKGVPLASVVAISPPSVCVCCGRSASRKVGANWYCSDHDQYTPKAVSA